MTTITPELLAEIKEKAVYASGDEWHSSPQEGGKGRCNLAQVWDAGGKSVAVIDSTEDPAVASSRAAHIARMAPPTTLALVAALEEAQRERDTAVKAHNEIATELTAAQTTAGEEILKADALCAENERLRAALEPFADIRDYIDYIDSEAGGYGDDEDLSLCTTDTTGRIHGLLTGLKLAVFSQARAALKETTHATNAPRS